MACRASGGRAGAESALRLRFVCERLADERGLGAHETTHKRRAGCRRHPRPRSPAGTTRGNGRRRLRSPRSARRSTIRAPDPVRQGGRERVRREEAGAGRLCSFRAPAGSGDRRFVPRPDRTDSVADVVNAAAHGALDDKTIRYPMDPGHHPDPEALESRMRGRGPGTRAAGLGSIGTGRSTVRPGGRRGRTAIPRQAGRSTAPAALPGTVGELDRGTRREPSTAKL